MKRTLLAAVAFAMSAAGYAAETSLEINACAL